jgi:hypothetical protein
MNTEKILQLAQYLEEEVDPMLFNMDVVAVRKSCGTVGCMIGHTPGCFPAEVRYTPSHHPDLITVQHIPTGRTGYRDVAMALFGLSEDTAFNLFNPGSQNEVFPDLPHLDEHSTPQEAAALLRRFVSEYNGQGTFINLHA